MMQMRNIEEDPRHLDNALFWLRHLCTFVRLCYTILRIIQLLELLGLHLGTAHCYDRVDGDIHVPRDTSTSTTT